jgi:hemolysin III
LHMMDKLRDPISALTHLAGAVAALLGLIVLLVLYRGEFPANVSLLVYGISLVLMFSASATYHIARSSPEVVAALRKVDHAAIYLLIAGTYTPFCVMAFEGFWRTGFLAIIWSLAVIGIITKLYFIHAPRWVTAGVYILMGWLSIFAIQEMLSALPALTIFWLFIGGVIYTAGAVVYITRRMNFIPGRFGFHEVWHLFVLLGAAAHFAAVVSFLSRSAS